MVCNAIDTCLNGKWSLIATISIIIDRDSHREGDGEMGREIEL